MARFPFLHQIDSMDCGPACLRMISHFYGNKVTIHQLQDLANQNRIGSTLADLSEAAESIGFRTFSAKISYSTLFEEKPFPVIVHWRQNHFIVVYKIKNDQVFVADPAVGLIRYKKNEFIKSWAIQNEEGIVLILEPTPKFYESDGLGDKETVTLSFFAKSLQPHKKLLAQLLLGLIGGSIINLMSPFFTQSLIDIGIQKRDINFIYLILIGQVMFFVGSTSVVIVRSWIILHVSTRLNIAIISDFLVKLMLLPIEFFDKKNLGDILQRIRDHDRIKSFLTSNSLQSAFSFVNILVFGIVLFYYDITIFLIYFGTSALYVFWVSVFLKSRKSIDYKRFSEASASQSSEIQLVQGMQEIKLNNAERSKRREWEQIQNRLFKINVSSLRLEQIQSVGGSVINESKNIFIMFFSAIKVIDGQMTLGMMMAATQIMGQLNYPLQQLILFFQQAQDAKISLDRLGDIHNKKNEDEATLQRFRNETINGSIKLNNVSFRYGGKHSPWVLKNVTMEIPEGKTTAIVGESGSGKTTLLKLILKFYTPQKGEILIGKNKIEDIPSSTWRKKSGVVMQEGFLFSDTILKNVTISSETVDYERFENSIQLACVDSFINGLPLKEITKIGNDGMGLSHGQKQRIMLARAIYKNPSFVFFDEATSSLDASNEKKITENINGFISGRTTVIIAHRLSTVKNADKILVLDQGEIVEEGTHLELISKRGKYFILIKNQLELGE